MEYQTVGTVELEPHHHELIAQFAEPILEGTFQQAVESFEIIFEREPKDDFEMEVFKLLCEQKIKERDGSNTGIMGVIEGGLKH